MSPGWWHEMCILNWVSQVSVGSESDGDSVAEHRDRQYTTLKNSLAKGEEEVK